MEQVFGIWPRLSVMARDIGQEPGTVRAWKRRGSIPAKLDVKLIAAARARGSALTADHLALLRAGVADVTIPKAEPATDVVAASQDATPETNNFQKRRVS